MAWHQPGDKPLSEPMMVNLLTHICVTWPQCVNPLFTCFSVMYKTTLEAFLLPKLSAFHKKKKIEKGY